MNTISGPKPQNKHMSKLTLPTLFTITIGGITTGLAIVCIAKIVLGAPISAYYVQSLAILTLVNAVNIIHLPTK